MRPVIYLDTSALNYLADHITDFDTFTEAKAGLNFELYLSPITLWEVLLNSNEERSDFLIYWGQFNCSKYLLKSPTEIIFDYIKLNCPLKSRKIFFDDPYTKSSLGEYWKSIHCQIERGIRYDLDELKERSTVIRGLSKKLGSILDSMCDEDTPPDFFDEALGHLLEHIYSSNPMTKEDEKFFKAALIFAFFFVCIGFELDNTVVQNYWEDIGIDDPVDRLDHLIANHPKVFLRGPLVEMAKMATIQLEMKNSKSRGLLHDCLHSVYCYYASNFISADAHFASLRDTINHPAFERIVMIDQLEHIWRETIQEYNSRNKESGNV